MTTYIAIPDTQTDPGAPVTSELLKTLTDNPIAIAEGASGAPKVQGIALSNLWLGAISPGTGWGGFTNLDNVGEVVSTHFLATLSGGSQTVQIRYTADNGATWGAAQTLYTTPAAGTYTKNGLHVNLVTGQVHLEEPAVTTTVPTNCNGFQVRSSSGSVVGHFIIIGGK